MLLGFGVHNAVAAGAVAVGETSDVAADGYAYGNAVNARSPSEASRLALQRCRNYKGAPKAVEQCKVVSTFTRECYAIALDPEAGTPGAGWAVGPTLEAARERSLAACEVTAGTGRQGKCKVDSSFCDINDSGVDKR
jgi:hypothetical protein